MIEQAFNKIFLMLQVVWTFILLMVIYLLVVLLYSDFGMDSILGLLVFHPLISSALSIATIAICYFIGKPLRNNLRYSKWLKQNYTLMILLAALGLTLIIVSLLPAFSATMTVTDEGRQVLEKVPNKYLAVSGWFIAAFASLHVFPQRIIDKKLQKVFGTGSQKASWEQVNDWKKLS